MLRSAPDTPSSPRPCSSVRAHSRCDAQRRQAKLTEIAALLAHKAAVRNHAAAADHTGVRHEGVAEGGLEPSAVRLGPAGLVLPRRLPPVRGSPRCPAGTRGTLSAHRSSRARSTTGPCCGLATSRTGRARSATRSAHASRRAGGRLVRRLVIQHVRRAPTASSGQREQRRDPEHTTFHQAKPSLKGSLAVPSPPSRLQNGWRAEVGSRTIEGTVQSRLCALRRHRCGAHWCFAGAMIVSY